MSKEESFIEALAAFFGMVLGIAVFFMIALMVSA